MSASESAKDLELPMACPAKTGSADLPWSLRSPSIQLDGTELQKGSFESLSSFRCSK